MEIREIFTIRFIHAACGVPIRKEPVTLENVADAVIGMQGINVERRTAVTLNPFDLDTVLANMGYMWTGGSFRGGQGRRHLIGVHLNTLVNEEALSLDGEAYKVINPHRLTQIRDHGLEEGR